MHYDVGAPRIRLGHGDKRKQTIAELVAPTSAVGSRDRIKI